MKKIAFYLLLLINLNLYSQQKTVDIKVKDSLNVFVVVDKDFTSIIDSFLFIVNTQFKEIYPLVTYGINISLYDNGNMTLCLDLIEQKEPIDSIVLYKNPYSVVRDLHSRTSLL